MFPSARLAEAADPFLDGLLAQLGTKPLRLCRTGKTRLVLYVEASDEDKAPYAPGVDWGWVKRVAIDVLKTKMSVASTSLVWLLKDKPIVKEDEVRTWPELARYVHAGGPPCALDDLALAKTLIDAAAAEWAPLLQAGRAGLPGHIEEELFTRVVSLARAAMQRIKACGGSRYYESAFIIIPVGVVQALDAKGDATKAQFVHAVMPATNFVARYGSAQQVEEFKGRVVAAYPRMHTSIFGKDDHPWWLARTERPIAEMVQLESEYKNEWARPAFCSIDSHTRGGYRRKQFNNTRADRRELGGDAGKVSCTARLSFNRSVDTVLGINPQIRRDFYKSVEHRMSWFSSFDKDAEAKRKAERRRAFVAPRFAYYFSSLLLDPAAGRGIGNRYFALSKVHA
jgi:hypothetical protein